MNAVQSMLKKLPTRAESLKTYHAILWREDSSEPGDADALDLAMKAIGKTRDGLAHDVDVIRRARSLQVTSDERMNLLPPLREANAAIEAHDAEMKRIIDDLKARQSELHRAANVINSKIEMCQQAALELSNLRLENREIFSLPPRDQSNAAMHSVIQLNAARPSSETDYRDHPQSHGPHTIRDLVSTQPVPPPYQDRPSYGPLPGELDVRNFHAA